jgi:hypothetical protein
MSPTLEKRSLQVAVSVACLVPLGAGGQGMIEGADMMRGIDPPLPVDLDSHFRYLSGLLFGIGLAFALCVPDIEKKGPLFRILAIIVFIGGLARLLSATQFGLPSGGHRFGLFMELVTVPSLTLWHLRVTRRCGGKRSSTTN